MLSFLGPIISLVSAPVKSYMEERTAKVQSKAKIAEAKENNIDDLFSKILRD